MASLVHNITGVLTKELLAIGDNIDTIQSILISNTHASSPSFLDVFIKKKCNTKYYFCKGYLLQKGETLVLDHKHVSFPNSIGEFGLYIKLTASASETPAVDVLIKK